MRFTEQQELLNKLNDKVRSQVLALGEELLSGESLGASHNIRQITQLFATIAEEWSTPNGEELIDNLVLTGDFFIETRGKNTPAIGNALRWVLNGIEEYRSAKLGEIQEFIINQRKQYDQQSLENVEKIANLGANLFSDINTLLAFDYSSTMMAILQKMADRGKLINVLIPESRSLDGGKPILDEATEMGHSVQFMVDMAFPYFLPKVDAVLIGVESFMANGDGWNTIGSIVVAHMAKLYHIPYYVATELIKIDPNSYLGAGKKLTMQDYSGLLNYPEGFKHPELVDVVAPELDNVPGELITAYITQNGIIPSQNIYSNAKEFLQSIGWQAE
jgi:ribose 1,5-bisphosphate isomerase